MLNPSKLQILITADLTDTGMGILRGSEDVEVQQVNPANAPALREKLQTAHALIARDDVIVDKALLDSAPVLRVIGRVREAIGKVSAPVGVR